MEQGPTLSGEVSSSLRRDLTERRLKTYTFLCVRSDGAIPAMELSLWVDETAARKRAGELLKEHGTASAVEIWDEEALCASVTRQLDAV